VNCASSGSTKLADSVDLPEVTVDPVLRAGTYKLEFRSNGWCGHVSVENALLPLIVGTSAQIFDDIVLADSSGKVLYQTQRSGVVVDDLTYLRTSTTSTSNSESSVKEKAESPGTLLSSVIGSSSVANILLAGTNYRAYFIPIRLPVPMASDAASSAGVRLVLCGLMLKKNFSSKSRSVPMTALAGMALIVLFVIVGTWPVLTFLTMRRAEQINGRAGLFYAVSIALTMMITIILVTHLNYGYADPKTDDNLEDLAKSIDRNVGSELDQALHVMDVVRSDQRFGVPHVVPQAAKGSKNSPATTTDLLSTVDMRVSSYPYFRRMFIYDGQGNELARWTVDTVAPPPLQVADRPYFQGVQRNDLWYLTSQGLSGARFRMDPIYSKSTGEYLAAIAVPHVFDRTGEGTELGVMTMVTPLLALISPVLPPDYGFAVIDSTGKVLFHSDSTRNGRENLFDELDDSRPVRSAVLARRRSWLTAEYTGESFRIFVTPVNSIQGCPWSLIVFSNRAVMADKTFDRILLLALLCSMYLVVLIAAAGLVGLLLPCRRIAWPVEHMKGVYCHLALMLAAVILLSYAVIFSATLRTLFWWEMFIPASAIAICVLRLRGLVRAIMWTGITFLIASLLGLVAGQGNWWTSPYLGMLLISLAYSSLTSTKLTAYFGTWNRLSLQTTYSLAAFALLILVAAIPSIAFFRFSYNYDENLAIRRDQLLTLAALNQREKRVTEQYIRVKISAEKGPFSDDLGKWLFLRRRLQEQKLDLYNQVFRTQSAGQVIVGGTTESWPKWWVSFTSAWVPRRSESLAPLIAENCTSGAKWEWNEIGEKRIRIQPTSQPRPTDDDSSTCAPPDSSTTDQRKGGDSNPAAGSPETVALQKLATRDPIFQVQDLTYSVDVLKPWDFLRLSFKWLSVLFVAMFVSVRSSLTRMFLLDWKTQDSRVHNPSPDGWHEAAWRETTLADAIANEKNAILVGLPKSGKTDSLTGNRKDIAIVDVATLSKNISPPEAKIVILDHFEYRMYDAAVVSRKLTLLEALHGKGKTVLIVTTIDPVFYLWELADQASAIGNGTGLTDSDMDRWARVLYQFTIFRLTGNAGKVTLELKDFYYHLLWSSCTWSEKMALVSLANHGWPNYRNYEALQHLWNRGLVTAAPDFRLIDSDLREFSETKVTEPEVRSERRKDTAGVWDGLRIAVIILLLGGLTALLFFNDKDILGIVTGAIGALTAASKIIAEVKGKGGSQAA
jgi:hypothetical protein